MEVLVLCATTHLFPFQTQKCLSHLQGNACMKERSVKTVDNGSGLFKQSLKSLYGLFVFQRCLTFDGVYAAL